MIICKPEVRFKKFSPAIMSILNCLYSLNLQKIPAFPEDFVITSVNDSLSHSTTSKHYQDLAMDVRSKNFTSLENKQFFKSRIQNYLGPKFTILLENEGTANEHFHIQVKKGEVYP